MEITSSEICSNLLFLLIRLSNFSIKTERNSRFFQPFPFHHRNFPPPRTHDLPSLPPSPSQSLSRQQKNPLIEAKHRSARKTCERMKGRKRKTNKARIPYAYDWRGTANEGKEREGGVEREKGWGEKERDKKKRKEVYPRRGVEGRQRGKQGGRQGGRQAGRASVHGRATHARSIKRAFTIDQRSIEVDHELKTVVTREARRPRQLFARLCKYLAAERRTRRWAPLGWGAVHARPAPSNHVQRYGARRVYVHTCIEEGGYNNTRPLPSPFPGFFPPWARTWNAAQRDRANFQRIIAPADRANRRDQEWLADRWSGTQWWIPEVHRQPPIPCDRVRS